MHSYGGVREGGLLRISVEDLRIFVPTQQYWGPP